MNRRRIRRLWWLVAPPSELRVVYSQIARWAYEVDKKTGVPPEGIASARRMARLFDDVPALVRSGRSPSGLALVLLQAAVEGPLIAGDGYSYRGRLSPRGRLFHAAWVEITRLMLQEGEITEQDYEAAHSDMRDIVRSRG